MDEPSELPKSNDNDTLIQQLQHSDQVNRLQTKLHQLTTQLAQAQDTIAELKREKESLTNGKEINAYMRLSLSPRVSPIPPTPPPITSPKVQSDPNNNSGPSLYDKQKLESRIVQLEQELALCKQLKITTKVVEVEPKPFVEAAIEVNEDCDLPVQGPMPLEPDEKELFHSRQHRRRYHRRSPSSSSRIWSFFPRLIQKF